MSEAVQKRLVAKFGDAILETTSYLGDETVVVDPARWREVAHFLRNERDLAFDMLTDLTAVDYPKRSPRFEVVVHLTSISKRHRIRLKARVGDEDGDGAEIDSLVSIWPGANWAERECYDLFGVTFRGHPDLRRILMYPEFEGHPLRKDYPAQLAQPLVPYRTEDEAGVPLEKLPPFRADEGMSFGRREWIPREEN